MKRGTSRRLFKRQMVFNRHWMREDLRRFGSTLSGVGSEQRATGRSKLSFLDMPDTAAHATSEKIGLRRVEDFV